MTTWELNTGYIISERCTSSQSSKLLANSMAKQLGLKGIASTVLRPTDPNTLQVAGGATMLVTFGVDTRVGR